MNNLSSARGLRVWAALVVSALAASLACTPLMAAEGNVTSSSSPSSSDALLLQEFGPDTANAKPDARVESRQNPQEIRKGIPMGGADGKSREQVYFERMIGRIEPDLQGKPERLGLYIEFFKRECVNDVRVFPLDLKAEWKDDTVVVSGHFVYDEHRSALAKFLKYLGFDKVRDDLEQLPSAKLGELRFGFVSVPRTFTKDLRGETMTECLLGDPVWLLRQEGDEKILILGMEGYAGYVPASDIARVNEEDFVNYRNGEMATLRADHTTPRGQFLPSGARLRVAANQDGEVALKLPNGEVATVPNSAVETRPTDANPLAKRAVDAASEYIGTPYVWGGNTSAGIDCSGLVQSSYKAQGINYPRDADQQSYLGALVATRWMRQGMRPGDTLYFLGSNNGRITHTAMYVGDNLYVEATGPKVRFTSLDPAHALYDAKRDKGFCFAKRLLE